MSMTSYETTPTYVPLPNNPTAWDEQLSEAEARLQRFLQDILPAGAREDFNRFYLSLLGMERNFLSLALNQIFEQVESGSETISNPLQTGIISELNYVENYFPNLYSFFYDIFGDETELGRTEALQDFGITEDPYQPSVEEPVVTTEETTQGTLGLPIDSRQPLLDPVELQETELVEPTPTTQPTTETQVGSYQYDPKTETYTVADFSDAQNEYLNRVISYINPDLADNIREMSINILIDDISAGRSGPIEEEALPEIADYMDTLDPFVQVEENGDPFFQPDVVYPTLDPTQELPEAEYEVTEPEVTLETGVGGGGGGDTGEVGGGDTGEVGGDGTDAGTGDSDLTSTTDDQGGGLTTEQKQNLWEDQLLPILQAGGDFVKTAIFGSSPSGGPKTIAEILEEWMDTSMDQLKGPITLTVDPNEGLLLEVKIPVNFEINGEPLQIKIFDENGDFVGVKEIGQAVYNGLEERWEVLEEGVFRPIGEIFDPAAGDTRNVVERIFDAAESTISTGGVSELEKEGWLDGVIGDIVKNELGYFDPETNTLEVGQEVTPKDLIEGDVFEDTLAQEETSLPIYEEQLSPEPEPRPEPIRVDEEQPLQDQGVLDVPVYNQEPLRDPLSPLEPIRVDEEQPLQDQGVLDLPVYNQEPLRDPLSPLEPIKVDEEQPEPQPEPQPEQPVVSPEEPKDKPPVGGQPIDLRDQPSPPEEPEEPSIVETLFGTPDGLTLLGMLGEQGTAPVQQDPFTPVDLPFTWELEEPIRLFDFVDYNPLRNIR